jgi:hypothetical protein
MPQAYRRNIAAYRRPAEWLCEVEECVLSRRLHDDLERHCDTARKA